MTSPALSPPALAATPPSLAARWLDLFRGLPVRSQVAGFVLLVFIVVAITGPAWAPFGASQIGTGRPFEGLSFAHLLGTDKLGRDLFSRVVRGTGSVFVLSLSATALAVSIGAALGVALAVAGGWVDEIAMRIVDIVISIPPIIFALLVLGSLGNDPVLVIVTVAAIYAPRSARVIRAAALSVVTEDFVDAARLRGEGSAGIALREVVPNVAGTIFVEFSVRAAYAIVFIGSLGFLGFGASPPTPEWGLMIAEGRATIGTSFWPVLAPALAMALLVIAITQFTDGIARLIGRPSSRTPRE